MGVCVFKEVHRRIDFKVYPRDQWGCALLYFTGSDNFNRSMRLLATKRGLNLNDHGVQALIHGKGNDRVLGSYIPCYSEEDVFKLLGLEYKPPHERNL
jgi:DNA polymerase/3'-5' exonuclease PolX